MWYNIGNFWKQEQNRGPTKPRPTYFSGCRAVANDPLSLALDTWDKFKASLTRRYGSLARAWRVEFDPDEKGSIKFKRFTDTCRVLGYKGEIRTSWCKFR